MSKKQLSNLKPLLEALAALEHEQWAHWTLYMLVHLTERNKMKWWQQISTKYEDLSEAEKDSDRKWARKALEIILAEHKIMRDTYGRKQRNPDNKI